VSISARIWGGIALLIAVLAVVWQLLHLGS